MYVETLLYFMEVASGKSYFEISESHNISQSSISKAIFKLEDELNVQLFNHKKRPPVLTEKGELFYRHLQDLYPLYEEMIKQIKEPARHFKINIDIFPTIDLCDMDIPLQGYRMNFNNTDYFIKLNPVATARIGIDHLNNNSSDFLITHRTYIFDALFEGEQLANDPFRVVLPKKHPLAHKNDLTIHDILNETVYLSDSSAWCALDEITKKVGVIMPAGLVDGDFNTQQILGRVRAGKGILLCFDSKIRPFNLEPFTIGELKDTPTFPIFVYRKKGEISLAQKLALDVLKDYFHTA